MGDERDYTLESSAEERARLARQADKLRPLTERLFRAAGIGPGMSVLDVGSGAGDVAMLAAELVGANGRVLGFDRDPRQVAAASARAVELPNVSFTVAEVAEPPDGEFDAVVGRLVLMYQRDLDDAVRRLAGRVRPGGVMAFVESNNRADAPLVVQWPPASSLDVAAQTWIRRGFAATETQFLVGLRLPSLYRACGLAPQQPYDSGAIVYEGREGAEMTAALVRAMSPVLTRDGVDPADIDIDTLADRLHAQHGDGRITAMGPLLGVWARKPSTP